jgi:hypothetical protein
MNLTPSAGALLKKSAFTCEYETEENSKAVKVKVTMCLKNSLFIAASFDLKFLLNTNIGKIE